MENRDYETPEFLLIRRCRIDILTASVDAGNGNDIEEDTGNNDGEWIGW